MGGREKSKGMGRISFFWNGVRRTGDELVPQAIPTPLILMLSPALIVCVVPKTSQKHFSVARVVARRVLMMSWKRILNGLLGRLKTGREEVCKISIRCWLRPGRV